MPNNKSIEFTLDNKTILATEGQTIAEAMMAAGHKTLRISKEGTHQGVFCGMGVCFGCRMIVDGIPNIRTCVTPVTLGCSVQTQNEADFVNTKEGIHEN